MPKKPAVPPLFTDSAKELLDKLSKHTGPAWEMAKEAEALLKTFEGWERDPPHASERAREVQRLIDLHRRAMNFLVKKSP